MWVMTGGTLETILVRTKEADGRIRRFNGCKTDVLRSLGTNGSGIAEADGVVVSQVVTCLSVNYFTRAVSSCSNYINTSHTCK